MWIFPRIKLSWHSCSVWDKHGWLNWFWEFLCEELSSFNPNIFCYSYAWYCSLCERRTSFCMELISWKLCGFWIMFWTCFISLSVIQLVSYFLFLYRSCSSLLSTVFDSISSNIYEILLINPSANVFEFGDFNVHHKDCLTCSGEFCYNFYISNDLTQMNIPTWIPDCDSDSPVILDFFLSFDTSICSTTAFPPLRNSNHVVVSVSIDFPINSKQDSPFDCIA